MFNLLSFISKLKQKIIYIRFGKTFIPDRPNIVKLFQSILKLIYFKEHNFRKNIIKNDIQKLKSDLFIDRSKGFKILKFSQIFNNDQLKILKKLILEYNTIDWINDEEVNRKKDFLLQKNLKINDDLNSIVTAILPVITEYIGSLPILAKASYWYSPNEKNVSGRSQSWHMDSEDIRQLKVMIPIDKINEENGALALVSANKSEDILKKFIKKEIVKSRNIKISDEIFENEIISYDKVSINLNEDEIGFIDTCRCYHYGSRKSKRPRKLIILHFTSAYSLYVPIFRRKTKNYKNNKVLDLVHVFRENNFYHSTKQNVKKWELKIL